MDSHLNALARDLDAEMAWLARLLQHRLDTYFASPPACPLLPGALPPPTLTAGQSAFADALLQQAVGDVERVAVGLALAPLLRPQLLDVLWVRNPQTQRGYAEFGGVASPVDGHFSPTLETALFIVAADDLASRLAALNRLGGEAGPADGELLLPLHPPAGESILSARLQPAPALLARLGVRAGSGDGEALPAQRVTTGLAWSDLVLPPATLAQLEEVRDWLVHGDALLHGLGMAARLRPGYTCLFHGPPGTGKTLTACLLGRLCEREVHRVDLSMVISKYIGETEKNLSRVFDLAEQRGWILFFDEADALFGQRTRVDSAHDRYANQEVSYLLQRIEDFTGVVILSSNLRGNIDDAFSRRFQSVIAFPMPAVEERYRLWSEALPAGLERDAEIDLVRLAERHEISGGTIMNVIRYAALRALVRGDRRLLAEDLDDGLRRELHKEGKGF